MTAIKLALYASVRGWTLVVPPPAGLRGPAAHLMCCFSTQAACNAKLKKYPFRIPPAYCSGSDTAPSPAAIASPRSGSQNTPKRD